MSRLSEVGPCLTEVGREWPSVSLNLRSGRCCSQSCLTEVDPRRAFVSLKLTPEARLSHRSWPPAAVPHHGAVGEAQVQDCRDLPQPLCGAVELGQVRRGPLGTRRCAQRSQGARVHAAGCGGLAVRVGPAGSAWMRCTGRHQTSPPLSQKAVVVVPSDGDV
jgi:hypothetical protein